MTREQLITSLKRYKENKAKLKLKIRERERILIQLEAIKEVEQKSKNKDINSSIHSKNSISDKVGCFVSEKIDKENELKQELETLEKQIGELNVIVEEIDIRLDALKYKEKEILIAYYIDGCTYEDIANRVYFKLFNQTRSDRHIRRMIQKYTDKILELY